jgi:hypothetical protein
MGQRRFVLLCGLLLVLGALWGLNSQVAAAGAAECSNRELRVGPSASLPDCRAYELVTPEDSNGRMLEPIGTFTLGRPADLFPTELASPEKDSFTYLAYAGALAVPGGGSGALDVYNADRGDAGWATRELASRSSSTVDWTLPGGVSSDHGYSFTNEGGTDYLRKPDGSYELTGIGSLASEPFAQGRYITAGGAHVVFSTGRTSELFQSSWCWAEKPSCKVRRLTENAPPEGKGAIYDRPADGLAHMVSLLPGDLLPPAGEEAFYRGTSKDGSAVAFAISPSSSNIQVGSLYVRIHNGEAANEKTLEVAGENLAYGGLSANGRYLVYVVGGDSGSIHRLDTETNEDVQINSVGEGKLVNVSENGTHIYFISREALSGSEANGYGETARPPAAGTGTTASGSELVTGVVTTEGTFLVGMEISGQGISPGTTISAVGSGTITLSKPATVSGGATLSAGFPNLFVWAEGALKYIATVAPSDLVQTSGRGGGAPALTNWTTHVTNLPAGGEQGPGADSSRTTPDGSVLVFESRARLASSDTSDCGEGKGCTEIYRYDNSTDTLMCASCSLSGAPESHDARLQELHLIGPQIVVRNVTDDGSHIFFETSEALVDEDTNEANDIYEWEEVEGATGVELISTGKSPAYPLPAGWASPFAPMPNLLLGIDPSGSNVFFTAKEALVAGAGENGTEAIYDARVDGGFPPPPSSQGCTEEQCRPGAPASSSSSLPLSENTHSNGNVKKTKRHCHKKGKHAACKRRHRGKERARISSLHPSSRTLVEAKEPPQSADSSSMLEPRESQPAANAADSPVGLSAGPGAAPFGIAKWEATLSSTKAGMHPEFTTNLEINNSLVNGMREANGALEEAAINLPPGLLGNPKAVRSCSMGDFVSFGNCSPDSQVGVSKVTVGKPVRTTAIVPIYNLTPPHPNRELARFGFIGYVYPVFIDVKVRAASDYGVTATIHDPPGLGVVIQATTTLWGNPAGIGHNEERFTTYEVANCPLGKACLAENEERPSGIPANERKAFMTNPSACQSGGLGLQVTSYQLPGQIFTASAPLAPITDCTGLPFAPSFEADPTSHVAGAPTGLKTTLKIPQHLGEDERATSTMREARVTLPAGMQVAAGAANWIGTCSDQQVGYHEEVDTACPDNAKLGTAKILSPALSVPIEGTIYLRSPQPGHQLGLWLTSDALGLHVKLPGELEPDKTTGRLTAVFRDLPQVPVEEIDLDVWGGPRAPLENPGHCGTYTTDFSFSPHSNDPAATGQSQMQISEGCNQPFAPVLHGGVTKPTAGKYSPFVFDLTRSDGDQALRGFELHLPDGELAKIKGVPLCSDDAASSASCPQGSRIGSLQATTGPGPDPFTLPEPGKAQPQIYLAGPYQGAPFSIVSEVPAQAGPFDLGTLAVRSGLDVEPETGRAVVKADPLPQFFEGVGIAYRHLHAVVDRPEFNLNPTDCSEMAVTADATSTQGTVAHPSARFQVDGCKALKFKPKLSLKLKGGTKRADYPALTAVLKARKGDANIARTSVALPHSEFLAQEHIGTICTRVQFAADKCPKGSVYGKAKAITPLLDKPLSGPVYLRSSNHPLPDLVAKLGGQLEIDLIGRIDSVHGGIRTTFESVPDAPVSKFVLQMKGGKKSLLTNSTDICRGAHRATVAMTAQNGRVATLRPALVAGCGSKRLGKHHKHH